MTKICKKVLAVLLSFMLVITTVFTTSSITALALTEGDFEYELINSKTQVSITKYIGKGGDIEIPNKIAGKPVVIINDYAFYRILKLNSVTIPNVVTSIGNQAFKDCTALTNIIIPSSVKTIGDMAFYGCTGLTSITIPNSVTDIGFSAFYGCTSLTDITIPDSVTNIGNSAFNSCTGLTSITLSGNIKSIGVSAFRNCTGITNITIPNGVTTIENYAFCDCTGLTSVNIPNSVKNIGWGSFYNCTGLTSVAIPDSVTNIGVYAFCSCDGLTEITIPENVTNIDVRAFFECSNLEKITIPKSVTSIGEKAFEGCTELTDVHIEDLTAWCNISFEDSYSNPLFYADNLYLNDELLTDIAIPNDVTSIGAYAFYNCTGFTSIAIPNSVKNIGEKAFEGCIGLKKVFITDLAAWCNISFTTPDSNPLYYAHDLYLNAEKLTNIVIPNGVTSIGNYAFYNCESLNSITLPNSVISIGEKAFYSCIGLTRVYINDLAAWCKISFKDCYSNPIYYTHNLYLNGEKLTNVLIPNSVTGLGQYVFYNFNELTSITIPNSVTIIGDYAFHGCTGLTSITIPNSVTSIGNAAFSRCQGLQEITLPFIGNKRQTAEDANQYPFGYIFGQDNYAGGISTQQYYYGISMFTTTSSTYFLPKKLKKVTITSGTYIPYGAFYNCTELTSITIPASVTGIDDFAFINCSGLENIIIDSNNSKYHVNGNCLIETKSKKLILGCKNSTIPTDGSVTSINKNAFYGCTGLTGITIPNAITNIGTHAFKDCVKLTSITIPNSVTSMGDAAFSGCSSIQSITLPFTGDKRHTATDTHQYPFGYIFGTENYAGGISTQQSYYDDNTDFATSTVYYLPKALKSVTLSSSTYIPYGAFENCSEIAIITISDSVTNINDSAFKNCSGLENIHVEYGNSKYHVNGNCLIETNAKKLVLGCKNSLIPTDGSVKSIGKNAFYGCTGLIGVIIPDDITSIDNSAFINCSKIESIIVDSNNSKYHSSENCLIETASKQLILGCKNSEIPSDSSVTSIGENAFYGCNKLELVKLSKFITSIGNDAFVGCSGIKGVIYCGTEGMWGDMSIGNNNDLLINANRDYHTFDNVCDTTCNICGYVRIAPHQYATVWSFDEISHWYKCELCGDKTGVEDHEFDNDCDTTCNVCGYTRTITHQHKTIWDKNAEQHWIECEICGDKIDIADHEYDNNCDTSCNICGYTRTITHQYKASWSADGAQHWHECEICGNKKDVEKHTFEDEGLSCSVCQYTLFDGDQNCTIVGTDSACEGQEIEYIVYLKNCADATSLGIEVNHGTGLSLVNAKWLKSGGLKTFNKANKQGALSKLDSPDVNGAIIKLTFKTTEASNTPQNISVRVIAKNKSTVLVDETITKSVTVSQYMPGDIDGDEEITDADAVYLLMHTFFPDDYPINQPCDFDGNGEITDADAVYLLMYTFFPDDYPIE